MLPDAPVFAVFLAAVVALTITPGPDMIYVASRALGQGRAAGVLSAFGVITGTFVHLGLAALGLAELFRYAPWAYDLVRYLGAAYLLYLAWRVASARDDPGFTAARGSRAGRARSYLQGLTTNPLDPEVALFYRNCSPRWGYAVLKMEFPSSVARMAWKTERPFWRPVSTTERTAAKRWAPHWERKPLVTLRKMTLGRSARSDALLV